jgi:hypothetical protein
MEERKIELHYNVFKSLKEQIEEQDCKCKNIELYDDFKTSIFTLYLHNILTESMKNDAIKRLHKQIVSDIRKENSEV